MPVSADPPTTPLAPAPERPRRRARAADLFERVVPEDPPTMRLSRIKPSTIDAKHLMDRAREDDATLPLGEDATMSLGDDATLPLGDDATLRMDDYRH
jgi:hypothetical protein